ncbi:hypothetical protein [Microbacterium xanthum]|uniref:hypothetical protein n=1 Tax=Microbacterium xanthum TaxID=3079794 RepID=UPI002AD32625|nr:MULTISPECIES: hypothetical protein [unclassified Microbacterium]MDZ8172564.1 hypothetical protein [Microbacterium sp. KSW-48]MDZ8202599.1 hypothetical protein [Microbacterium sp. SSW1-59]
MPSSAQYVLVDLEDEIRLIHDTRYAENDSRRLVAFVEPAHEGQVAVTWLRSLPLRTRFPNAVAALAEIESWSALERAGGATPPVPIAHYAPRRIARPLPRRSRRA